MASKEIERGGGQREKKSEEGSAASRERQRKRSSPIKRPMKLWNPTIGGREKEGDE